MGPLFRCAQRPRLRRMGPAFRCAQRPRLRRMGPAFQAGCGGFGLDEDVVSRGRPQRHAQLAMAHEARHAAVGEELERGQRERRRARGAEERQHRRQIGDGEEHDVGARGQACQLQRRFGDDAERAFGADEQLAQVAAGVVLLERAVELEHGAVHEHDLEAEHPVARQAVADDLHAARVGRDVAADVARALRGEVDRPGQARGRAVLVHRRRNRLSKVFRRPPGAGRLHRGRPTNGTDRHPRSDSSTHCRFQNSGRPAAMPT